MEADWEVELGAAAPVIDPHWPGFVDLRVQPERARELPEVAEAPSLADALIVLNSSASPVWTAKCDMWQADAFDPDELDAPGEGSLLALGCYIDLLPAGATKWQALNEVADWCRSVCGRLRAVPLRSCRVDLVVRHANLAEERLRLGVTAYLTAAGADRAAAAVTLAAAMAALADSLCIGHDSASAGSQLQ